MNFGIRALTLFALVIAACGGAGTGVVAPAAPASDNATAATVATDPALAELRIDYATYSPPSLVLKRMGWVYEALHLERALQRAAV